MGGGDGTGLVGQTHCRQASSNNYSRLGPSTPAQQFMHPFIWPSAQLPPLYRASGEPFYLDSMKHNTWGP